MTTRQKIALEVRECRVAVEQVLLNRALRNNKGTVDRLITRLVLTQIPTVPDDQTGGSPNQRGRLDAPARPPSR